MNVFDLGFNKVIGLVSNSITLVLHTFAIYSIVGFVIGMFIVLLAWKKNWCTRAQDNKFFLNIIYVIFIPIVLAAFLGGFTSLKKSQQFLIKHVYETITPLTQMSYPAFQFYVSSSWPKIVKHKLTYNEVVDGYVKTIHFEHKTTTIRQKKELEIANTMVPKIVKWGINSVIHNGILDPRNKKGITNKLKMSKRINVYRYKQKFWEKVENEIVAYVNEFYTPLYIQLISIFLILVSIPVIDLLLCIKNRKNEQLN